VTTYDDLTKAELVALLRQRDEALASWEPTQKGLHSDVEQGNADFLANISHEIRTPLNAVLGLGHLLSKTELTKRQQDYVEKILKSGAGLLGVINDILDFSRIAAEGLVLEKVEFNIIDVMDEVAGLAGYQARDKGLKFLMDVAPEIPCRLVGDPFRLGQVLNNLAGNAVKFTIEGRVCVRVALLSIQREHVRLGFSVSDTGVGITDLEKIRLFKPFTQGDTSSTRRYGGAGLGLSICSEIIRLMGGALSVESVPGEGSTFSFSVVFEQAITASPPKTNDHARKLRVLIVEDDETISQVLADMLASHASSIEMVDTAEEAGRMIAVRTEEGEPFHLVLMDFYLPGIDGIEATRRVMSNWGGESPPQVVIMSGRDDSQIRREAKEAGALRFVSKPLTQKYLDEIVQTVFEHYAFSERAITVFPKNAAADAIANANRILLVEDNKINREVAGEILARQGYCVETAHNGRQAVAAVLDAVPPFDLVLMDLQMPEMDGIEATKRIRSHESFAALPIIALSADAVNDVRDNLRAAGIDDFVSKPIDMEALYTTVARWVPRRVTPRTSGVGAVQVLAADRRIVGAVTAKGLDPEKGLSILGGDVETYSRIVTRFKEGYADTVDRIEKCLDMDDRVEAKRLAHSLKSVSGNIGAGDLYLVAQRLDARLAEENVFMSDLTGLLAQARVEIDLTVSFIDEWLAEQGAPPSPERRCSSPSRPLDNEIVSQLNKLASLLSEGDMDAREVAERFIESVADLGVTAELEMLSDFIEEFEFERASELLDDITKKLRL
jgi:two-component system, sensor histidine kinase and response regulator